MTNIVSYIGLFILIIFVSILLIWAYFYNIHRKYLFVSFLSIMFLIYSIINLIYLILNKENIDNDVFIILLETTIYYIILSFVVAVVFTLHTLQII